ncbi:glycerol-3-phosphate acyltransferase [Planococcus sp. S3-L1]|uniref:glycerol-3-phosphate acyltransferase n=1 Tax=Planococcus sp. S3-L1 TaxID=3046200 RepID=UPI0024BA129B|nr:glycerol-3-phosphate acyltransferase [Planococcus sp. S3-L1]MDJ0330314.1 glycerol-3-phosphate acyltransferase [Planococcus sp. S3-L1]
MIVYWLVSYLIGNFLTAWWIGKWKGVDLRQQRSGNLGARNAGAILGKSAFVLTFLGDAGKGALVVWIGFFFNFSIWAMAVAGLAVILGHLFPFWLKYRGGKGIAAFVGVTFCLTPDLFLVMFILFLAFYPWFKSATLSMLASFTGFVTMALLLQVWFVIWPLFIAIIVIVIKHKSDIEKSFNSRFR